MVGPLKKALLARRDAWIGAQVGEVLDDGMKFRARGVSTELLAEIYIEAAWFLAHSYAGEHVDKLRHLSDELGRMSRERIRQRLQDRLCMADELEEYATRAEALAVAARDGHEDA